MSEGVMQVIGYVGIVVFALLAAAVIARFRLEFYEIGKERLLKRKIREKTLIPAANQSLEDVAEKLREALDFQAKKVEVGKNEIDVNLFADGVKSEITIRIKPQDGYFVVRPLISDALHWNIAGQVEETLAYVCGEKSSISNDDARYEFAKLLRIRKFEKKYKWLCIGVTIVWLAVFIFLYYNTTDYIEAVKGAVLTDTDAPIGEVFDDFFGEQEWSNADANVDGYAFVIMNGACYYEVSVDSSREKVNVEIEFLIQEESGELTIQNISVDGELLDTTAQAALIEDVYETHMARTSFQSVEDLLTDFGNFIGNEMMEGLMGHYVSYYSEEEEESAEGSGEAEEEEAIAEETVMEENEEDIVAEVSEPESLEENLTEPEGTVDTDNPYQDSILLWKSFDTPLTNEDFMGLSQEELRIARNEIYAAYGRIFTSQDLIDYFNSKPWYQGTTPADQFDDSVLTQVQKDNIEMIQLYEDLAGQEENSQLYSGNDLTSEEQGIPQTPGEYTYVNNSDDSQYVTLTVGSDVSLTFWGATGYSQELSGFSNMNDQEYYNAGAEVSLIFNNYGREMVYIMSDGTQITYTFSYEESREHCKIRYQLCRKRWCGSISFCSFTGYKIPKFPRNEGVQICPTPPYEYILFS